MPIRLPTLSGISTFKLLATFVEPLELGEFQREHFFEEPAAGMRRAPLLLEREPEAFLHQKLLWRYRQIIPGAHRLKHALQVFVRS